MFNAKTAKRFTTEESSLMIHLFCGIRVRVCVCVFMESAFLKINIFFASLFLVHDNNMTIRKCEMLFLFEILLVIYNIIQCKNKLHTINTIL